MAEEQAWPANIGPYEVEGVLGRGGFGVVLQARDTKLGRTVAIKALLDSAADIAGFQREAALLAELTHPNIVQVHTILEHEGSPMIVMEFVNGITLSRWLGVRPPPVAMARLLILEQVAEAIAHAHTKGVQHRDLKPQNIMVTNNGTVKVLDFGIARRRRGDGQDSLTATMMGTLSYMSPEQLNLGRTSFRSDEFAFGVIAYEVLSGRHPFPGDTDFQIQLGIVQHQPPPLFNLVPGIPPGLVAVLQRCMEKDPMARYPDMGEVRRQLQRVLTPLKQAEARNVSEQAMAAFQAGRRAEAVQLAEWAERLDPACPSLQILQERLEGNTPNRTVVEQAQTPTPVHIPTPTPHPSHPQYPSVRVPGMPPVPTTHPVTKSGGGSGALWVVLGGLVLLGFIGVIGILAYIGQQASKPKPQEKGDVRFDQTDGLPYVWIPPGTFRMGCGSEEDKPCDADELPAHEVEITKGFWMGQTEVTTAAYKRFAKATSSSLPAEPVFQGKNLNPKWSVDSLPMSMMSWGDAQAYCAWAGLRLPTEAEWEFAARGGVAGRYGAPDDIAWYGNNSGDSPIDAAQLIKMESKAYNEALGRNNNRQRTVGQKAPNDYKLYDMMGNVWEWTADWYQPKYEGDGPVKDPKGPAEGKARVMRGGSTNNIVNNMRPSFRDQEDPEKRYTNVGFRCVGDVPTP